MADGFVMIQCINNVGKIFTQITAGIVRTGQQLRCLIYQVRGQQVIKYAFFICFIELFDAVGEKTKGRAEEDTVGFQFF